MDFFKPSHSIFFIVWIITVGLRLFELRLAKQNLIKRKGNSNLQEVKESYFFLFIILHTSFLIAVPLEIYFLNRSFHLLLGLSCLVIYTICVIFRINILSTLRENWNVKVIYDPKSHEGIVTTGLYKYIRHPNYLVVILEIASISLLHGAYYSFVFFTLGNFCILYFRIRKEESVLMLNPYYAEHFKDKKRFIPYFF